MPAIARMARIIRRGRSWTILDVPAFVNTVDFPSFDCAAAPKLTILPTSRTSKSRWVLSLLLTALLGLAGCAHEEPILIAETKYFEGEMPADFSGFWARDYTRSDDINKVLQNATYELGKRSGHVTAAGPMASERDMRLFMPLARLVELITRTDELTISQSEYEILVERRDDFSLMCAFYDGVAKPTDSAFGRETCGWDGDRLISLIEFPDGLRVVHRFQTSEDRKQLRVITTASSDTAPMPFTVTHY
jgi:hypothetical protein